MAYMRAVCYELQPIRFASVDAGAWRAYMHQYGIKARHILTETFPTAARAFWEFLLRMSSQGWMIVGGALTYCYAIRYIHEALDAGPLVLILSALVAIFTIGLGNNENRDGISAYSVFNRGFQSIMGSVDVEALVQQHVGGAMGVGAMGLAGADDRRNEAPVRRHPMPARIEDEEEDDEEDERAVRPQSRKSGKKARRGNLEQRRELKRQRQAAIAMGFGGDGGHEEQLAMQQILEEQIAANEARENN